MLLQHIFLRINLKLQLRVVVKWEFTTLSAPWTSPRSDCSLTGGGKCLQFDVNRGHILRTSCNRWRHHLTHPFCSTSRNQEKCNQSIYDYMRLVVWLDLRILQLQDQISTILVILTTMMQLLKISSFWLDRFYIYFHPLIGWYVPLVPIVTKLVAC
jgi:hypothetical protein